MDDINEKLERLIVRSLDGMLDDEQQLALDRELIRNPEARRMMDEYRSADLLAAAALAEITTQTTDVDRIVAVATRGGPLDLHASRRANRAWMLIPGAIAAAVLAMVIPRPDFEAAKDITVPIVSATPSPSQLTRLDGQGSQQRMNQNRAPLRTVGSKSSIRRRSGTEWIGVMGDDGNVYWIEVERSRTISTPKNQRRNGGTFLEM